VPRRKTEPGSGTTLPATDPVANAVLVPAQPEGHSNPLIAASKPLAFGVTTFAAELHVPTLSVNVNVIDLSIYPSPLIPCLDSSPELREMFRVCHGS